MAEKKKEPGGKVLPWRPQCVFSAKMLGLEDDKAPGKVLRHDTKRKGRSKPPRSGKK